MTTILGVSCLYHDAAAAVVRDGEIIAAAQEERFTRKKHDRHYPEAAIAYCIDQTGGAEALDAVVFYEDPVLSLDRILKNAIELAPATGQTWAAAARSQLGQSLNVAERLRQILPPRAGDNVFFVDHHLSHAASAFYPSPFREAAIVVADGIGEWASTTIAAGNDRTVTPLRQIHYPHSLGLLYSAVTYHCGLKVNSGEYKLMGLAPYGEPRYADLILDRLVDLREDGSYRLDTAFFGYLDSEAATNAAFEELFGCKRRDPESPITIEYMDIAASAQAVVEEAMFRLARRALRDAESRNLCLAGGVALNCVANGRLLQRLSNLDHIWIQPASGDAGGAVGAALELAHSQFGAARHAGVENGRDGMRGSLLGPAFGSADIEAALKAKGLVYHRVESRATHDEAVAQALVEGLIIGRFDGPMEYGPRALGNRSILADPRRPDGQSYINQRIKFRESWRPFAPVVLADKAAEIFETEHDSPYMLLIADVRAELRRGEVDWHAFRDGTGDMMSVLNEERSTLPAITHVDYSARLQTVDAEGNPAFHRLMTAFYRLTGCPVLINTSFNVRGEPIVCTPEDAVACFINAGIDLLAIGDFLVFKHEQPEEIRRLEGTMQYEPD